MTNAMIILWESVSLMEQGIIKGTGEYIEVEKSDGEKVKLELPEAIHTYATWKAKGRQVKRGEKCKARFCIWKKGKDKTTVDDESGEETTSAGRMFMKESFFFTFDQTEPCKA